MVVDDSEPMRVLVRRLLEPQDTGFDCVAEAGGLDQALSVYAESRPDIVLLDLNLAADDGFTVASRLLEFDPHARLVLLTGAASPDVAARATEAGIAGVVNKGDLPQLAERLRALA